MEAPQFKPIEGYTGLYEINNLGQIQSIEHIVIKANGNKQKVKSCIISKSIDSRGYHKVTLCKNGTKKYFLLHRLIAIHFIENTKNKEFVNHIDENKLNNNLNNLEWVTNRENVCYSIKKDESIGVRKRYNGKFTATIRIKGKDTHLGTFASDKLASQAYKKELKKNNITNKYC